MENEWWNSLNIPWKKALINSLKYQNKLTAENWFNKRYNSKYVDFNISEYTLAEIFRIKELTLRGVHNFIYGITPLNELRNIRILNLSGTQIRDISFLENLNKMTHLSCSNNNVADFSYINNFKELIFLNCGSTNFSDFTQINKLNSLKIICAGNLYSCLNSLNGIENLYNLEYLKISSSSVTNLEPLYGLTKLRELDIWKTNISHQELKRFKEINPLCEIVRYNE